MFQILVGEADRIPLEPEAARSQVGDEIANASRVETGGGGEMAHRRGARQADQGGAEGGEVLASTRLA